MVVLYHTFRMGENIGGRLPEWMHGLHAGVDLFFVISGYVVSLSCFKAFEKQEFKLQKFLVDRLIRVAPMYWIGTMVYIGVSYIGIKTQRDISTGTLVRSLFFLPTDFPGQTLQSTIVPVGWTLVYEMFFYVSLGLAAHFFKKHFVVPIILAAVLVAPLHFVSSNFLISHYCHPLFLEFAFGVFLVGNHRRLNTLIARLLMLTGVVTTVLCCYIVRQEPFGVSTLCVLPFAALACFGAKHANPRGTYFLGWVGNASFSIYLTHGYILNPVLKLQLPLMSQYVFAPVAALFIGYVIHIALEKPLTVFIKTRIIGYRNEIASAP